MATAPDYALNGWDEPAPERQGMTDEEIVSILRDQERAAVSFRETVLAGEQAAALDFYEAEPFGDEEEGRSQVIVPDVAEVCDYMQISILRTVASADRVVEFEPGDTDQIPELPEPPEKPDMPPPQPGQPPAEMPPEYLEAKAAYDAQMKQFRKWEKDRDKAADDATAAVNYIFMRRQNGYRILVDWLQSGLIEKIGIIKTACVTERKKIKTGGTVSEDQLAMMVQEGEQPSQVTDNGDGTFQIVMTQIQEVKRYVDYTIPSEEYIFPPRMGWDEDASRYQAHRSRKTLSDLIEMGFDREKVEALPSDDGNTAFDDARSLSRWREDENLDAYQRAPGMREVMLLEEYARLDLDDDGVAELWQVFRVGDVILSMEEVDEAPFVVWTPFPRAHRLVGNSLAEKTMDIQRVKSVLLRQGLDGVYQANKGRMWLPEESTTPDTIDDLLSPFPDAIVRGRGAFPPQRITDAFDITKSLGMMEYVDGMRETRTGITRLNQGLDADTINKTASGQAALQATGQQMEEFVARNFAEALARLFGKKLRLMASNGNPIAMKVDGNYRRVDPTSWDGDMNVVVRVGLGSGSKEMRLTLRKDVLEQQVEALPYGITDKKRVYKQASAWFRDAGLGNPDDAWLDPESEEAEAAAANQPPKEDPEAIKAKGEAEAAQAKVQADMAKAQGEQALKAQQLQVEAQLKAVAQDQDLAQKREEAALKAQLAEAEADRNARLAEAKAQFEADLATQAAAFEQQMALRQADFNEQLAERNAQHRASMAEEATVAKMRPGGDLDK